MARSQTTFAIECAIDDLAKLLGIDPFEIRRINKVRETDRIEFDLEGSRPTSSSAATASINASIWSRRR